MLGQLCKGDVVVYGKLARLSHSLKDLLKPMEKIQNLSAEFKILTESIDKTSPVGRMIMQIVGSFAKFERAMLRERTCNGLSAASKEGCIGGGRHKLKENQQQEIIQMNVEVGQMMENKDRKIRKLTGSKRLKNHFLI